jgi:hypothetical protein
MASVSGSDPGADEWAALMNFLVMFNDEVAIFRAMDEVVGLVLAEPRLHR